MIIIPGLTKLSPEIDFRHIRDKCRVKTLLPSNSEYILVTIPISFIVSDILAISAKKQNLLLSHSIHRLFILLQAITRNQ